MTNAPNGLLSWQTLSSQVLYSAPPFVSVLLEQVQLPSGQIVPDYHRVLLPNFAICVPQLTDGRYLAMYQYKHGPQKVSLTFPSGHIDEGEAPIEACKRELLEETGFIAREYTALGQFVDSGNQQGSIGHFYFASDCSFSRLANSGDLEEAELVALTVDEIESLVDSDAFAIVHHVTAWLLTSRFLNTMREA